MLDLPKSIGIMIGITDHIENTNETGVREKFQSKFPHSSILQTKKIKYTHTVSRKLLLSWMEKKVNVEISPSFV